MNHLSESKKKARYQLAETDMSISKTGTKFCLVTGKTFHINSSPIGDGMSHDASSPPPAREVQFAPCLACSDGVTNLNIVRHDMET